MLEALVRLPEKLKIVIYLHYTEGYKSSEIAKMLSISVQAVKKRMQRGRKPGIMHFDAGLYFLSAWQGTDRGRNASDHRFLCEKGLCIG